MIDDLFPNAAQLEQGYRFTIGKRTAVLINPWASFGGGSGPLWLLLGARCKFTIGSSGLIDAVSQHVDDERQVIWFKLLGNEQQISTALRLIQPRWIRGLNRETSSVGLGISDIGRLYQRGISPTYMGNW